MCFQLAESLFDRIKIRRILWQITQPRTGRFNRLAHTGDFVRGEIVHDDGIAAIERRGQTLPDIGDESWPVHRPIDHEGCDHPIVAQAGDEGDGLPMSMRDVANQSCAPRAPTAESHHLSAGGGLVEKHQAGWVKHALLSMPTPARAGHVRPMLLRGAQTFF